MQSDDQEGSAAAIEQRAWVAVLLLTVTIALVADARVTEVLAGNQHYIGDFTVFWTAGRVEQGQLYDAWAITEAQKSLVGGQPGLRPFVNPPSALPWLAPFAHLTFPLALMCWTVVSLVAFFSAARHYIRGWSVAVLAIGPLVWVSAATGQLSLLLGAALMTAVAILPKRPVLAGIALGLAATVKPHVVLLAPLALIAAREWRALGAATATGVLIGATCVIVQGTRLWLDWIAAASNFPALVESEGLTSSGIALSSIPAPEWASGLIAGAGVALGAACVWLAFARSTDSHIRLIGLVIGCLLASPYARRYDLVAMQPAVVALLLNRGGGPLNWSFGMVGMVAGTQVWSVLALALGVITRRLRSPLEGRRREEPQAPAITRVGAAT